ncbi:LOW QUALITY PROTEIN: splicing factor U2AF 65 kDa subunit [Dioscorea cayenensis subsp. rotundata]|uniref:LOW QUALITY PROTEIN: splicing factor U2AF 65 kDa subunit n=1 Tax=Dioscorea cayennensis subsp. rotundata TaxID=55577 RepID=A0AB40CHN6_DIOCR|nr:LOW QUALITY PROTEIN: splicing factor U2AF 65 kDa subunit [Dioscorea cayenensis subsp. rotundata]
MKDLDEEVKKSTNRTDERIIKREGDHSEGKDKKNLGLDSRLRQDSTSNKSGRDRESREEKHTHHKARTAAQPGDHSGKGTDKKRFKDTLEKNKHDVRGRVSKGEGKRKHHSRSDDKERADIDLSILKRQDSGKLKDTKHSDRNYQKKEHSQAHHEESRSKRRRSRSREHVRERDRSPSNSPRAARQSHHERDHGELSSFKDKSRRKYHDDDKYRTSGNGGYSSGHQRKRGSGLGGYSPRKRRTEVAVNNPPAVQSPERKSAKWDQPPAGSSHAHTGSLLATLQSSVSKIQELVSPSPLTSSTIKPKSAHSIDVTLQGVSVSIDSVQLTQATRPIRRLYIENLPPSATEKALVDCLNDFVLSSGVNHIQGTKPCISCIVNKEKCQAVVEFLTPEDATAALSFDGKSLFGSVLKIRRPKDFVEAATGNQEKLQAAVKTISDVVEDSPNKIFIAGISNVLSSDMVSKIVSAFGSLKAYHFEFKEEINGPCAFVEYEEPSTTLKACAGLNGMKLGGNVLIAVQATPHAHLEEDTRGIPSYDIPEPAKPLLASPTKVLQLKNMLVQEELLLLSDHEIEETLEDIRLECARFGTIKSLNLVRYKSNSGADPMVPVKETNGESTRIESTEGGSHTERNNLIPSSNTEELKGERDADQDTSTSDTELIKSSEAKDNPDDSTLQRELLKVASPQITIDDHVNDKVEPMPKSEANAEIAIDVEDKPDSGNENGKETPAEDANMKSMFVKKTEVGDKQAQDLKLFEAGCVLVEYLREEAACKAAHCLHGRSYGERVIATGYVPHDLYLLQFPR